MRQTWQPKADAELERDILDSLPTLVRSPAHWGGFILREASKVNPFLARYDQTNFFR